MLNYTISNPISFGGLQNYITSSNTNLFTMPRAARRRAPTLNSSELRFFIAKFTI